MARPFMRQHPSHRRATSILTVALALIGLAFRVNAQTASGEYTASPTHQIRFQDSDDIASVAFAADGTRAYVLLRVIGTDLWSMAVYLWPEILGALLALCVLGLIVRVRRVTRRHRISGDPYCRRCNYHLAGLERATDAPRVCPECGTDLRQRRPVVGRSRRRDLAPAAIIVLVLALAYASLWAARVPRRGSWSGWFVWPSVRLERWAESRNIAWLRLHRGMFNRVVEVDPATGRRVRTMLTTRGFTGLDIRASPDGESLFLASADGLGVGQFSARTGRETTRVRLWDHEHPEDPGILGFSPDGRIVYLGYLDEPHGTDVIAAWDPVSGGLEKLVERPAPSGWPGRSLLLPGPDRKFLVASNFQDAYTGGRYEGYFVSVVRPSPSEPGARMRLNPASPSGWPVVTPDGRRVFVSGASRGIAGADLESGVSLGLLSCPDMMTPLDELAVDPTGRFLFISVHPRSILVRDMDKQRWAARLDFPAKLIAPKLKIAPNGSWLAATPFWSAGARGPYVRELLLYDLRNTPLAVPDGQ